MRVSLKQPEIVAAIAFYLTAKGLKAEGLDVKFTTTRVGPNAGISAEFDVEDAGVPTKSERVSGGVTEKAETPKPVAEAKPETAQAPVEPQPGTVAAGGFTPPAEDAQLATPVTDEVAQAQAEDAAADAAEAKPAEGNSLFD